MKSWILRAAQVRNRVSGEVFMEVFETEMEALERAKHYHELVGENYLVVTPIEINFLERGK